MEAIELKQEPRVSAARRSGLQTYSCGPTTDDPAGHVFIGTKIGLFGPEDAARLSMPVNELAQKIEEVTTRLRAAGLEGGVALHVEWFEDL